MKPSTDREAISLIIDGLIERGCTVTDVVDGAGEKFRFSDKEEGLDNLTSCDESWLYVTTPEDNESFIWFVLGNDPEEVACDYGVSLSKYLDPIIDPWWE